MRFCQTDLAANAYRLSRMLAEDRRFGTVDPTGGNGANDGILAQILKTDGWKVRRSGAAGEKGGRQGVVLARGGATPRSAVSMCMPAEKDRGYPGHETTHALNRSPGAPTAYAQAILRPRLHPRHPRPPHCFQPAILPYLCTLTLSPNPAPAPADDRSTASTLPPLAHHPPHWPFPCLCPSRTDSLHPPFRHDLNVQTLSLPLRPAHAHAPPDPRSTTSTAAAWSTTRPARSSARCRAACGTTRPWPTPRPSAAPAPPRAPCWRR